MKNIQDNIFKEIVNNIPGFVFQLNFRKDGSSYWSYISQKGIEMLKMPEDIVGRDWELGHRIDEKSRVGFQAAVKESVQSLKELDHEFLYITPEGERIWFHGTGTPSPQGDEIVLNGVVLDITRQKEQENQIRDNEEKFRRLYTETPAIMHSIDKQGLIVSVSNQWLKILGYRSDEVIGRKSTDFLTEESRKHVAGVAMPSLFKDGFIRNIELRFIKKNGKLMDVLLSAVTEKDKNEEVIHAHAVLTDVTELNKGKENLERSEALHRALFQGAGDAIMLVKDGVIIDCNKSTLKIFGYKSKTEIIGKSPWAISPELQEDGLSSTDAGKHFLDKALKGKPAVFEWKHKKSDGTVFDTEINLNKIVLKNDPHLIVNIRDISERKQAEEAIQFEQYLLHSFMDNTPDVIYFKDLNSRFIRINKAHAKIFGLKNPQDAIGKTDFDFFKDEHSNIAYMDEQEIIKSGQPIINKLDKETWLDGRITWSLTSKLPLYDQEGKITGTFGISREITKQKKAEEALKDNEFRIKEAQRIANFGYWDLDIVNNKLRWSDDLYQIFDLKPQEFEATYEAFLENIHPEDRGLVNNAYTNSLKTKSPYNIVHRLKLKDGTIKYVQERCESVFDKEGNPLRSIGTVHDITEQKSVENELMQEKRFSDAMINSLPGIFYAYEDYQRLVMWNKNHETMTGYSANELKNMSPLDFFIGENLEKASKTIETVVKTGYGSVEADLLNKDGTFTPYHFSGTRFNMNNKDYFCGFGLDITDRRKTENELKNYREHLEELVKERTSELEESNREIVKLSEAVKQSPTTVVITDTKGNIEYVNPMFTSVSGYSFEEVLGKNPRVLNAGKLPKSYYKSMWDTINRGKIWNGEFINKKKTGEIYTERISISPVINESRETTHFVAIKLDVTEEKKLQEELRIFKQLAESSGEGFGMADMTAKILYMNKRGCDLLEINNIPVNESFMKFYTEEAIKLLTDKILPETQAKGQWQGELDFLTAKGNIVPTYHNFFLIKDDNGQPIRLAAIISDITKRKQIEEELGQFKSFADTTTEGFGMADLGGNILYQNKALNDLLELKKTPYGHPMLKYFTSESKELFKKEIEGSLFKKGNWQGEITTLSAKSNVVSAYMNLFVLRNTSGEPVRLAAVLQDITLRKQIEIELQKSKEQAEEANNAKSAFLANMSHEIRTPMNSILGFSEILSTKITDTKHKSYLNSIHSSGKSLLTLINDILDLSKVEAGKVEISYESVNTRSFFDEIINIFQLKIEEKDLEFHFNIDKNLSHSIYMDELRLRQIIINLMSNAVKFTSKGYIKLSVEQEASSIEKQAITEDEFIDIRIKVEDTGIGISRTFLTKVFKTFEQEDSQISRKYGGTGLGLAISKRLAEMMNGDILVDSEPKKGSTFSLWLKKVKVSQEIQESEVDRIIKADQVKFQSNTVFVADDNEEIRKYFSEVLSDVELKVRVFINGKKLLEQAKKENPDLIITDIKMPVMGGYELVDKLKNDPKLKNIPVIAVSASVMKEAIIKIKEHKFDSFLIKPILLSDLYTELMKFLSHQRLDERPEIITDSVENSIDESVKKLIPEVVKKLEVEFMKIWEAFEEKQPMNDVNAFGSELKNLGEQNKIKMISQYGDSLLSAVENFDIDRMQKVLKEYPKIIEQLKTFQ